MSYSVLPVAWDDPRAMGMRDLLNAEMQVRYTGRHDDDPGFAAKAEVAFAIDPHTVVATLLAMDGTGRVLGHAAVRNLDGRFEVKRVIVHPSARGRGIARVLMAATEEVAREHGKGSIFLQTGDRQLDAVVLYESLGYRAIPVYPPYLQITNSLCFEKQLD